MKDLINAVGITYNKQEMSDNQEQSPKEPEQKSEKEIQKELLKKKIQMVVVGLASIASFVGSVYSLFEQEPEIAKSLAGLGGAAARLFNIRATGGIL